MPASYKNARFHCEVNSRESGRRIITHEFPKKELPYSEDMGRKARQFTLRGYCIVFPYDSPIELYQRDYRVPRDRLIKALEDENSGLLQLPTQIWERVVCTQYRLTEEQRFGGYCVFDMTFAESGLDPLMEPPVTDTKYPIDVEAKQLRAVARQRINLSQEPVPEI
jgi:prophage DNA circulation protein